MTDRQLRSFLAAAEQKSFSKAAELSYISTPSFAQQIKLLEKELGFDLFIRSSKGVELTEAGELFYEKTKEALSLLDNGAKAALSLATREQKTIRISHNAVEALPAFLSEIALLFKRTHPEVELVFHPSSYSSWVKDIEQSISDICFFMPPNEDEMSFLCFENLYDDDLYVCLSPDDPLVEKSILTADDLAGNALYIDPAYKDSAAFHGFFDEYTDILRVIEDPFSEAQVMKVALGGGAIPSPSRYLSSCCPPLVAVKLEWSPLAQGIVFRKDASELIFDFVAAARDYFS